jgi:hypothetical protein
VKAYESPVWHLWGQTVSPSFGLVIVVLILAGFALIFVILILTVFAWLVRLLVTACRSFRDGWTRGKNHP